LFNLIKITLIKFNLYNFIRHSSLYYLILKFKNPSYTKSLNKDFLFFNKILKKKKLIFDVGSNQGDKAFVFSKIGQKIILFEPDKICRDFLENRFKNFKNILIEKIALTGRKAEKKSFITVENNSSYNSLNLKRINFLKNNFKYLLKRIYIKTKSINFYIKKYGIPDFLKIDTQGSELDILAGAESIIDKVDIVYLECPIINYNIGAPSIGEYIAYMKLKRFIPMDVLEIHRSEEVLLQVDILFIHERARNIVFGKNTHIKPFA
jgi:FkbM family methyltransferase